MLLSLEERMAETRGEIRGVIKGKIEVYLSIGKSDEEILNLVNASEEVVLPIIQELKNMSYSEEERRARQNARVRISIYQLKGHSVEEIIKWLDYPEEYTLQLIEELKTFNKLSRLEEYQVNAYFEGHAEGEIGVYLCMGISVEEMATLSGYAKGYILHVIEKLQEKVQTGFMAGDAVEEIVKQSGLTEEYVFQLIEEHKQ